MNRTDINRISEVVLIPLFAEIFGYTALKNLNTPQQPNFPGIDLGDETARVAFQITASTDNKKIKKTLTQFVKHHHYEKYDRLLIYILTKKQRSYSGAGHEEIIHSRFNFDKKHDIIDFRDLLANIATMQICKAKRIEEILEANFGDRSAAPFTDTQTHADSSSPQRWYSLGRLPSTGSLLVGRAAWLRLLDEAWKSARTKLVSIVAEGGVGKTGLANHWLKSIELRSQKYNGADYVWTWSFYNQADKQGQGLASADEFISWGLRGVNDPSPDDGTPWDRGSRLAVALRQKNGILILDGLEPLQHPPGPMIGRLRDHGLLGFLREFAAGNTGLCVTTSRLPLMDLSDFVGSAVTERKLKPLTAQQGERMLRGLQVKGTRNERIKAAQAFRGHCLGLTLLAAYLTHRYGGDPRRYREVRPLSADRKEQHHARRILNAYGKWFQGRLEHSILYAMSFFERAVDLSTIANLIETLRDWLPVRAFDFEELKDAVVGLSDLGLLYNLASQGTIWLVDTHPLIREHFSEDLRRSARNAWRAGHAQLFQDLSRRVPQQPVSRDELEILHTAVRHGCFADCRPEALEVLAKRIFQLDELGEQYLSLHKFGMYAEGLSALTGFFRERWKSVYQDLSSSQQAQILVVAGYCLRAVGALDDAAIATAEAQSLFEPINVNEAADAAGNLTQMLVASGKLREAVEAGLRAVEIGAACPDPKRRKERYNLASLADAYHQAGMLRESEECFARSEELQKSVFPDLPFLISYRGFLYCDLLLGFGRLTEVRKRAKSSLRHPKSSAHPGIQGLDLLSIGRSYLAERPPHLKSARTSLQKAEELVRQGGQLDELPRVLLAVAELRLLEGDAERALKEVRQAQWLSERTGQNLRIVDSLIVRSQIEYSSGHRRKTAKTLNEVSDLATPMGYARGLVTADKMIRLN